jgi:hypothetical protein
MAQTIQLKVLSFHEFAVREGKEIHATVSIEDLINANGSQESYLRWNFPLEANVRRPSANAITKSIVESLESDPFMVVSSPIHVSATCKITASKSIQLTFNDLDGILDGGHRMLAFAQASNKRINLSQATTTVVIYSNFSREALRDKAIALNTSKAVSSMSLSNYRGDYDDIKPLLEKYRIAYYEGQHGSYSVGVEGCCTISRIAQIVLILDPSYNPANLTSKCHPTAFVKSGAMHTRKDYKERLRFMMQLAEDAIELQSTLLLIVNDRHEKGKKTPFTAQTNDPRRRTKLPTGEILSCTVSKQSFLFPIISAFRAAIIESDNGKKISIQVPNPHRKRLLSKMLSRYLEVIAQIKYQGQGQAAISQDTYVWNEMYAIVQGYFQDANTLTEKAA